MENNHKRDITEQEFSMIGDMIAWTTSQKVNYYEEDYRIFQQDPRYLDSKSQTKLNKKRKILWAQLWQWIEEEAKIYEIVSIHIQELTELLYNWEQEKFAHHYIERHF